MADDVQHTISDGLTYCVQYRQFHALRKTRLCYAHCDPGGIRTRDLSIKSAVLYRLSYKVKN